MAECTKIDQSEVERREKYMREYLRPRVLYDPLTWSYPARTALYTAIAGASIISLHNYWNKKPWYFAIFPRVIGMGVAVVAGYGMGALRRYHYKTRDAVVEHYVQLHPTDFQHLNDYYGRPYSEVFMPWIPVRAQYFTFEEKEEAPAAQ